MVPTNYYRLEQEDDFSPDLWMQHMDQSSHLFIQTVLVLRTCRNHCMCYIMAAAWRPIRICNKYYDYLFFWSVIYRTLWWAFYPASRSRGKWPGHSFCLLGWPLQQMTTIYLRVFWCPDNNELCQKMDLAEWRQLSSWWSPLWIAPFSQLTVICHRTLLSTLPKRVLLYHVHLSDHY